MQATSVVRRRGVTRRVLIASSLAAIVVGSVLLVAQASGSSGCVVICFPWKSPSSAGQYVYAASAYYPVRFVCNSINSTAASTIGLEPGFYQTDINVHNPSFLKSNLTIVLKFIAATPLDPLLLPPIIQYDLANPSPYVIVWAKLGPDAALSVDCAQILKLVPAGTAAQPSYAEEGYVLIYTAYGSTAKNPLDVTVGYSTSACLSSAISCPVSPSIDMTQVPPEPFQR